MMISDISSRVIGFISSAVTSVPGLILSTILAIISSVLFAVDYSKITVYCRIVSAPAPKSSVRSERFCHRHWINVSKGLQRHTAPVIF